ncbi:MAG: oligopeptide:H+ symporter, partial [Actinobacteria bacterium]|nr:oligopeptide:H+ symporter [Actinomycetota bacterium]
MRPDVRHDRPVTTADAPRRAPRTFFGHPLGLVTLFSTELWERFSFYGMRAILLYFVTDTAANDGLGLDEATGTALVAVYGSVVYLLSVLGGWLADRMIGARRSVLYGGVVIASGHVFLALPGHATAYLGIILVAVGTGLLKPNVSSMVGQLYGREDPRRDSAFSIFYMGINIGALAAPLVVGAARSVGGYHAGFAVAAFGMAVALGFYVAGHRLLGTAGIEVPNRLTRADTPAVLRLAGWVALGVGVAAVIGWFALDSTAQGPVALLVAINALAYLAIGAPIVTLVVMFRSPKVSAAERSRLRAYVPLFVAAVFFWMIAEQASSTLSVYARDHTTLTLAGVAISPELFQSVGPAAIIALAPLFAWLWVRLGDRPGTAVKFAIGLALAAVSFLFLALMSGLADGGRTPAWVLVAVYVVQTLGELCLSPVGLAATTLLAPR